ncbi:prepilin peptidase [Roseovarius salis]|uniref:prepilin peptidase n=1 Tax=Roseovarius salis TaxID=3376063 RepID=UPI0037C71D53
MIAITPAEALWFLPPVLPIAFWVMWSDLSRMRIPNLAVMLLAGAFLIVGLLALPMTEYAWRVGTMLAVLVLGFLANVIGLMGAGDSKFIAAAAPFIDPGDGVLLVFVFTANLLACFATHRLAKHTPLRRLAPGWTSWESGRKFPMGFALAGTLLIYLGLGAAGGA